MGAVNGLKNVTIMEYTKYNFLQARFRVVLYKTKYTFRRKYYLPSGKKREKMFRAGNPQLDSIEPGQFQLDSRVIRVELELVPAL